SYPPSTVDYTPIVRAIQAAKPDAVFVASYPPDSAGIIRAAHEVGLKATVFGGGMIGLQFASVKEQFGPLLNGIVYYELYTPEPTLNFPGIAEFLKKYQPRAKVVGDVKFGKDGEWVEARMLYVQERGITGNDIEQFKQPGHEVVLYPAEYKSGDIMAPYGDSTH